MRHVDLFVPFAVLDRGANAIAPSPFVLVAWRSEGRAGKLLTVQAIVDFLRAVLTDGQCTGQHLCLEIITEARHVASGDPLAVRGHRHSRQG